MGKSLKPLMLDTQGRMPVWLSFLEGEDKIIVGFEDDKERKELDTEGKTPVMLEVSRSKVILWVEEDNG